MEDGGKSGSPYLRDEFVFIFCLISAFSIYFVTLHIRAPIFEFETMVGNSSSKYFGYGIDIYDYNAERAPRDASTFVTGGTCLYEGKIGNITFNESQLKLLQPDFAVNEVVYGRPWQEAAYC